MNLDLYCYYKPSSETYIYEYPSDYIPLKVYDRIGSNEYNKTTSLQLSVERTGDIITYSFFKCPNTGGYIGINLHINGFIYTKLDKLAELFAPEVDAITNMISYRDKTLYVKEELIKPLFDHLRSTLISSSRYGAKPLSPMDYSISTDYRQSYQWSASIADEIIRSTEEGETHIVDLYQEEDLHVKPYNKLIEGPKKGPTFLIIIAVIVFLGNLIRACGPLFVS